MSQENVEAMRVAMEAFNRRDADAFGAPAEDLFAPRDGKRPPVRLIALHGGRPTRRWYRCATIGTLEGV